MESISTSKLWKWPNPKAEAKLPDFKWDHLDATMKAETISQTPQVSKIMMFPVEQVALAWEVTVYHRDNF